MYRHEEVLKELGITDVRFLPKDARSVIITFNQKRKMASRQETLDSLKELSEEIGNEIIAWWNEGGKEDYESQVSKVNAQKTSFNIARPKVEVVETPKVEIVEEVKTPEPIKQEAQITEIKTPVEVVTPDTEVITPAPANVEEKKERGWGVNWGW